MEIPEVVDVDAGLECSLVDPESECVIVDTRLEVAVVDAGTDECELAKSLEANKQRMR